MTVDTSGSNGLRSTPLLSDTGLLEYLEKDIRPTFAFAVKTDSTARESGLAIGFINSALQRDLHDFETSLQDPTDEETACFISWAKDESCSTQYVYRNHIWTATEVKPRQRVVSGTFQSAAQQSPYKDYGNKNGVSDLAMESIPSTVNRHESRSSVIRTLDFLHASNTISSQHYRLIRDFDWAKSSIGPIVSWPQPLVHALPLMLSNAAPCAIFWGSDRTMIYNESYANVIQKLHPAAMGASALVNFAAFWPQFEAVMVQVEETKQAVRQEASRTVLDRQSGSPEEAFFTYIFLPLLDEEGRVCGIFNDAVEVTKETITHRQMNTLFCIGNSTAAMTSLGDFWNGVFKALRTFTPDLPFVAVYSLDDTSLDYKSSNSGAHENDPRRNEVGIWHLEGSVGFPEGHPATVQNIHHSDETGIAPALKQMLINAEHLVFDKGENLLSQYLFTGCVDRGSGTNFSKLALCPLSFSSDRTFATIIIGVNPLRPYDDEYARFLNLLSRIIEDTATSVLLVQKEKKRLEETVKLAEQQRKWLSGQLEQQTKEARQSELRFYNFAEQSPVGVYILGPEGHIKYCNQAWHELTGIPKDSLKSLPWRTQVHPDDIEAVDQQWKWLTEGRTQLNFEWRAVTTDEHDKPPSIRYLRSSAFPELAEDGSMESVTGILMDVSVHKAHEQAIAEQLTNALEAKRARENFIDMVSHEIRNPLNAMLQCAEEASQLLASQPNSDEILEVVETIQYCGRHQKHIVDDVLTISKLDSNLLTLSPEEVMPISILDRVEKIFTSDFRSGGIEVTHEALGDCDTHYLMDASRVLQIVINLVGNACKFLKDRPIRKLFLSVHTSSEVPHLTTMEYVPQAWQRQESSAQTDWGSGDPVYVHYSVTDTGPGLTAEEMSSLFARFKQASPRTHAQYGGSGLGLFISRQLAEMHGGRIGISSNLEQGSTFAFYVKAYKIVSRASANSTPVHDIHTDPMSTMNSIGPRFVRRHSTKPSDIQILIVEDNLVNQKVLQRQLARIGFHVLTANHGEEALSVVQHSCSWYENTNKEAPWISIILCDLEMPVMDGLTCASHIRQWQKEGKIDRHIPMIAVTGNARKERQTMAIETGFDQVVTKPYSVPDLVPLIKQLAAEP